MSNKCDCLEIGYKSCRCEERYATANKSAVMPGSDAVMDAAYEFVASMIAKSGCNS